MGCNTSTLAVTPITADGEGSLLSTDPQNFSETQKHIVKRTWKIMSSDLCGNGVKVFLKIFYINPTLRDLFPFGWKTDKALGEDDVFKGHASRFMQAVGAAVENIEQLDAKMGPLFIHLGKQHVHYRGFKPCYWAAFLEAMMSVWAQELGGKFTIDAQLTWKALIDFILNKAKEGYAIAIVDENAKKNLDALPEHDG